MLPGKKLTVPDIVRIVRRRLWLLVIPPAVTFFAALVYSSTIPNLYESHMLIAIDPQRVPDTFVRSTVTLETERRMEALIVKVLSRTSLQQLIEKFDLYPEERHIRPIEEIVAKMHRSVQVPLEIPRPRWGQVPQPTAFHVRFTYHEPVLAARVTEEIGRLFVEQNSSERGSLAGATNRFLETQLAESRKELEAQERRLEAFREQHGKELPTQVTSNMNALTNAQLRVQSLVESMARDRDRKQMLERLYRDAVAEPVATPAPIPGSPATAAPLTAQQQLAAARANLAALNVRYKPDHPDVVRAERQIAELEPKAAAEQQQQTSAVQAAGNTEALPPVSALDASRRERLRQMQAEIESLDRQVAFKESEEIRIRADIAEYQRRIEAVPGLESEWVALTRDYDTQQAAYKELLTKSSAAQVALNLEQQDIGETFRIVDAATVPKQPVPSTRGATNAAGFAIGLLLGLAIAVMLELKDATYRTDNDVLELLSLPVLAAVPHVQTASDKLRQRRRRLAASLAGVTGVAIAGYMTWTLKLWNSLI
jgi:polysaccharide chain length determinant protein (PEP-CTERM system associated)